MFGWFDLPLTIAGLGIGFIVGLTGMGGGALMTPVLVFFFRIDPLTAISSDIVISLLMKPFGAVVHLRRRTVNLQMVGWLCLGSVPAAFVGVLTINVLKVGENFNTVILRVLGAALLLASAGLILRAWTGMVNRNTLVGEGPASVVTPRPVIRPVATVALGAIAGFVVGLTSVGAGSIIIVVLLLLYPALKASQLVGTDLVQAVPLVASAALGHLLFGDVSFAVAGSVLVGAIPGAFFGAQVSTRAPGGLIRRALAILLLASGLKLVGAPNEWVFGAAVAAFVLGNLVWILLRRRFSASLRREREGNQSQRAGANPAPAGEVSDDG